MKFGIQMFYRAWGGVFSSSKMSTFDFYWIPITLTITHYQNRLLINRKWKWCSMVLLLALFLWSSKQLWVFKRFYFHFCQTLIILTIQSHYNELLMNLEIKIGVSLCDSDIWFLFKTKFSQPCWTFAEGISTE